jgi:hypothetical protein
VTVRGLAIVKDTEYTGQRSQAVSFRTRQSHPSFPRDMRVRNGSVTSTSVWIQWEKPQSPNGVMSFYAVSWTLGLDTNSTRTQTNVNANTTETILTGLNPATTYSVWVYAVNKKNKRKRLWSPSSSVVRFTTLSDGK